ncbi:hypothetical protein PUN28_019974 [Cardiocondyla obscurior]|uniref:Uncharacterized protein n=1 Tax=Cardiocondyla obscurior TaxID=286306 RepID=A0AAW2EC07_9HYME
MHDRRQRRNIRFGQTTANFAASEIIFPEETPYHEKFIVRKLSEESLHESRVGNYPNKHNSAVRRNLTTDNLCTVYPIMRRCLRSKWTPRPVIRSDPNRYSRPSKDKTLSVPVASRDPFKEVRLGGDCKTTRSFQGPPLSSGISPRPYGAKLSMESYYDLSRGN